MINGLAYGTCRPVNEDGTKQGNRRHKTWHLVPPPGDSLWVHVVLALLFLPGRLRPKMTWSTKPEVHKILSRQRRIEPRSRGTCTENFVNFGHVAFEILERTDMQTDRLTDDTLIAILRTSHLYRRRGRIWLPAYRWGDEIPQMRLCTISLPYWKTNSCSHLNMRLDRENVDQSVNNVVDFQRLFAQKNTQTRNVGQCPTWWSPCRT